MGTGIRTQTAILQVLIKGPSFGLEIMERVRERSQGAINLGPGSVYPALRELEREGLLQSFEGEPVPERGGTPRVYYRLTAKGARAATEDRQIAIGLFDLPVPEGMR